MFVHRNGLSLRQKTSVALKDPSMLIDKLVPYTLHVKPFVAKYNYSPANITTMDDMPVWLDMFSDTITQDKTG